MKLKKFMCVAFATMLMSVPAFAQDVRVSVNAALVDFDGQGATVVEGRTLIPVRGVFDKLGYSVNWDAESKVVTLTKDSVTITVPVGSNVITKNGEATTIDVPAQIIEGRTMLPLRAIGDAAGCEVAWDAETKIASIVDIFGYEREYYNFETTNMEALKFAEEMNAINDKIVQAVTPFMDVYKEFNNVTPAEIDNTQLMELMQKVSTMSKSANSTFNQIKSELSGVTVPAGGERVYEAAMNCLDVEINATNLISEVFDKIMAGETPTQEQMDALQKIGGEEGATMTLYNEITKEYIDSIKN